jgi:hypothetical protein
MIVDVQVEVVVVNRIEGLKPLQDVREALRFREIDRVRWCCVSASVRRPCGKLQSWSVVENVPAPLNSASGGLRIVMVDDQGENAAEQERCEGHRRDPPGFDAGHCRFQRPVVREGSGNQEGFPPVLPMMF